MSNIMANVYYKLVVSGMRTIEQVPENLRAEVQALLDKDSTATTQPTE